MTGERFEVFLYYPYQAGQFAKDYPAANGYHPVAGVGEQAVTLTQRTELDAVKAPRC